MEISKDNVGRLRRELQAVLDKFAEEHEFGAIIIGTIRWDNSEFGCKITAKNRNVMIERATTTGPIKVGDKFFRNRTIYEVTSVTNPGKSSILLVTGKGKRYKIKPEQLLEMERWLN